MTGAGAPTPRGGVRLGSVVGVPVLIGPSWFLMAAFLTFSIGQALVGSIGAGQAYVVGGSFAVLLGLSVLLHEMGHCFVARAFGLPVRRITIGFMAGATEITEPPQTPGREYAVAVAGPMVSLLLAGLGVGLLPLFDRSSLTGRVVENVAITNGLIAAFNLLPGLPLDGGRVLRALIWRVWGDPERATWAAAWAGRVVAVVVVPLVLVVLLPWAGYGGNGSTNVIWAALIAAYIYSMATATLKRSEAMRRLPAVSVAALARPALRVPADMPLAEAVRRAQAANMRGLVVVDAADRLEAVVSEAAVVATPEQRRPWVTVGMLAKRLEPGLLLDPSLRGEALLDAMRAHPSAEYVSEDKATGEVRVLVSDDVAKALTA
ncbi:MAG: Zn-dependent protease-like protein [Frankiales bacterium]|jgi:Zn-dependent protease/CBS domain-containing protein|nr:Zn-dependent protease-like protein [Frankiales bacterium]